MEQEDFSVKISVRELIEFIMRSGDIDNSLKSSVRAVEGTRAHQKLQKEGGEGYLSEVSLKIEEKVSDILFSVEGRADGIFEEEGIVTIDEIKTVAFDISNLKDCISGLHLAQAKCYAYMYGILNDIKQLGVRITYYNIENSDIKRFKYIFTIEELKDYFYDILNKYSIFAKYKKAWSIKRDNSITTGKFPFDSYRKGQREMASEIYRNIRAKNKIFLKAPTGIGKTISSIFPSIKALGEGLCSMIFYLTAKNTTGDVAEETLRLFRSTGYFIKDIRITAKEKICFNDEISCNPEGCIYAKGHYDRVNDAIIDILNNEDSFTRENVIKYAKLHKVCPFEFSLDLTYFSDVVICDYNYVFDPHVMLKRFFDNSKIDAVLLIDEAHNLPDRAREMYSETIYKSKILAASKFFKDSHKGIYKALKNINKYLIDIKKSCDENGVLKKKELDNDFVKLLRKFTLSFDPYIKEGHKIPQDILELYFDVLSFIKISELYDDSFITYAEAIDKEVSYKIFCIDPSNLLKECFKKVRSSVLFSATLIPINYYKDVLGEEEGDKALRFLSPFPSENLCLLSAPVSTRYIHRSKTINKIAEFIEEAVSHKKGNYLVFFPSYKYMEDVYNILISREQPLNIMKQKSDMKDQERVEFLNSFSLDNLNTLVGFAVLGGVFSEGVDLKGDRLVGAVIVGVGLPKICLERDIIKDYYQHKNGKGYEYAYTYPGMNKVLQASGRVIRTESDRGLVLLIDDRYVREEYRSLFPVEWSSIKYINEKHEVKHYAEDFFNE